jgi:hypothetical protein
VSGAAAPRLTVWRRYPALRIATLVVTGSLLALAVYNLAILIPYMISQKAAIGVDYTLYTTATDRWLQGGSFYLERQLNGPYTIQDGDILYPPTVLLLLVPFRFLPAIAWWIIPTVIIVWACWRLRPAWWSWPILALIIWYPRAEAMYFFGNPGLWVMAALALATRWRAVAALALVKLSLGPFALFGARHRSWWIALALLGLASLPFVSLWLEYLRVARDSSVSPVYSLQDVPQTALPLIAWLARTRPDGSGPASALLPARTGRIHPREVTQ